MITIAGIPQITDYSTFLGNLGVTVYNQATVSAAIFDNTQATTAQAVAGAITGTIMNPVTTKNAIVAQAFTSANFSSTAQAAAGTDATTVMNPVLTKNAIAALASGSAGLTVIASGNLATGSPTVVDITSIPQTYRSLVLYVKGATNSVATRALQVDVDFGNGLGSGNNFASYHQINNTTASSFVGATNIIWSIVTQTAAQTSSCIINFHAYQSGPIKQYDGMFSTADTAGSEFNTAANLGNVEGVFINNGVVETRGLTGIRITWNNVATGVFDGGTYTLYGVN